MAWKIMVCGIRLTVVPFVLALTLLIAPFCVGFGLLLLVFFLVVNIVRFIAAAAANDRETASQTLPLLFTYHIPQWFDLFVRLLMTPVRWTRWAFEPFRPGVPSAESENADGLSP